MKNRTQTAPGRENPPVEKPKGFSRVSNGASGGNLFSNKQVLSQNGGWMNGEIMRDPHQESILCAVLQAWAALIHPLLSCCHFGLTEINGLKSSENW